MNIRISHIIAAYYDKLYKPWLYDHVVALMSNIVALPFIFGVILSLLYYLNIIHDVGQNKFPSIEMAFFISRIVSIDCYLCTY